MGLGAGRARLHQRQVCRVRREGRRGATAGSAVSWTQRFLEESRTSICSVCLQNRWNVWLLRQRKRSLDFFRQPTECCLMEARPGIVEPDPGTLNSEQLEQLRDFKSIVSEKTRQHS
ncbi:RIIa domain-containing protein 1 isoform X3 [Mastomys coucha]|uniref:RIIa domain-containing protein 1 isoform X3 n=1 Tax=Mastomys coucha TaxID=35658 RepID=UPI00126209AB|nr:RIIa domain-containing protein 1 isoform X3 [Mastomys coucha]